MKTFNDLPLELRLQIFQTSCDRSRHVWFDKQKNKVKDLYMKNRVLHYDGFCRIGDNDIWMTLSDKTNYIEENAVCYTFEKHGGCFDAYISYVWRFLGTERVVIDIWCGYLWKDDGYPFIKSEEARVAWHNAREEGLPVF